MSGLKFLFICTTVAAVMLQGTTSASLICELNFLAQLYISYTITQYGSMIAQSFVHFFHNLQSIQSALRISRLSTVFLTHALTPSVPAIPMQYVCQITVVAVMPSSMLETQR